VAQRYMETFQRARTERRDFTTSGFAIKPLDKHHGELPPLKLDHLQRMTDNTGILQHAGFTVPNYSEGYTIDDNARALIVATLLEEMGSGAAADLATRYLAFVWYGFNTATGRFRNFMDYQHHWLEESGSDDSHGRTLWALGTVLGRSTNPSLQSMAGSVFERALPAILNTTSPRAWAFAIIGIHEYLRRFSGDSRANQIRNELAERLLTIYQKSRSHTWRWYEEGLTYCNAVLPQAMLMCGQWIPNSAMTEAGLESLKWLADLQRTDINGGHFVPIGSNGFYERDGERAHFDQQPVEAQAMISACLEAYRSTGDECWRKEAQYAFEWFLGRNDLNLPLYDGTTGGCRDGLHPDRPNENQGAESTLAFLQSWLELRLAENTVLSVGQNL
ncbi:MAG: glycosyl transferase family 1, partial [Chloroflexi bacterium]|nr:glycosyl transferase family 1 [Chloroflexota bacterium]